MHVLDQRLHDLPQARIGDVLPALQRDVGKVVFGDVGHGHLLESLLLACCCAGSIKAGMIASSGRGCKAETAGARAELAPASSA